MSHMTDSLSTYYLPTACIWMDRHNNNEIQRQKVGEVLLFPQKDEAKMLLLSIFILHSGRKGTWIPTGGAAQLARLPLTEKINLVKL